MKPIYATTILTPAAGSGVDGKNWEVFVANRDGTGEERYTFASQGEEAPTWSPDGSLIAVSVDRERIDVMNALPGASPVTLYGPYPNTKDPDWSPDGLRIAFSSAADGDEEIFVIGRDGAGSAKLTDNRAGDNRPRWIRY